MVPGIVTTCRGGGDQPLLAKMIFMARGLPRSLALEHWLRALGFYRSKNP
jgi:hypothetical protein